MAFTDDTIPAARSTARGNQFTVHFGVGGGALTIEGVVSDNVGVKLAV